MGNTSNEIKKHFTQVILIVFSVVLGIYLGERIEERKNVQASADLLTTIKIELKDNLGLLRKWYPYHEEINENLDTLSKDPVFIANFIKDKYFFFEKILTKGTFMGRSPAQDAWEIAKSHPLIVNIDYDIYLILSRVYNQQKVTYENAGEMFDLFNSREINLEQNAAANLDILSNLIHDFVAREKQLVIYYKEAEKILELKK